MKDLKISKELLSEVLNYEVDVFLGINKNEIDYTCCRDENEGYVDISINLYEFAFKCKEWAFKNKYKIQSQINESNKGHSHITKKNDDCWAKGFFEDTEIEVIIKACEFILTKRNQNENK